MPGPPQPVPQPALRWTIGLLVTVAITGSLSLAVDLREPLQGTLDLVNGTTGTVTEATGDLADTAGATTDTVSDATRETTEAVTTVLDDTSDVFTGDDGAIEATVDVDASDHGRDADRAGSEAGAVAGRGPGGAGSMPWSARAGSGPDLVTRQHEPLEQGPHATPTPAPTTGPVNSEASDTGGQGPSQQLALPDARAAALPATVSLVGLLTFWTLRLKHLGILGLGAFYSRISREDVLESGVRRDLLELIKSQPGLCVQRLNEEMSLGWGATVYHLDRLEHAGLVRSRRQGKHRRFFAAGEQRSEDLEALSTLREDTPRRLAHRLLQAPGSIQRDLAADLDIAAPTVHKHISRMEDLGLVVQAREGRRVRYRPTPRLARLLQAVAHDDREAPVPA